MRGILLLFMVALFSIILLFGNRPNKILAAGICNLTTKVLCHTSNGMCSIPETQTRCDGSD